MSNQPRTYDPAAVIATVGGLTMQGFGEDTKIEIEEMGDGFTSMTGTDGEVSRAKGTDRRHQVTITLAQTSPSNDALSNLYDLDRRANGGATFPVTISDLSGRTVFAASWAWINKKPTVTFGREVGERAWVLTTGEPSVWTVGGNS